MSIQQFLSYHYPVLISGIAKSFQTSVHLGLTLLFWIGSIQFPIIDISTVVTFFCLSFCCYRFFFNFWQCLNVILNWEWLEVLGGWVAPVHWGTSFWIIKQETGTFLNSKIWTILLRGKYPLSCLSTENHFSFIRKKLSCSSHPTILCGVYIAYG